MRSTTLSLLASAMAICVATTLGHAQAPQPADVPTFTKDVAPILYANCASCHRPGEIAPMSLLTYAEARPWAQAIGRRVADGSMPPWHADAPHGTFANERSLTQGRIDQVSLILQRHGKHLGGHPRGNASLARVCR